MYWITERMNGTYDCSYLIQDGTEYFTEKTLDLAIERMIQAAWYMNHGKIHASDISFTREREMLRPATVEVVREPFTPPTPLASESVDEVGPTKVPKGPQGAPHEDRGRTMSTATDYLRMSYREFQQEKRAAPARLLWDAAKAEDGITMDRVRLLPSLSEISVTDAVIALGRAIRNGHLIEVRRHFADGRVVTLYQPMGERP